MPGPRRLILRLLLASVLVLGVVQGCQQTIAQWLVPVMRVSMMAAQQEFRILSVDSRLQGASQVMRLQANLAAPLFVEGRAVYPIDGWFEATLTLGGILGYGLLALIVVLAWPAKPTELLARLVIVIPMIVLLTVINTVSTLSAELWSPYLAEVDPDRLWPSMMWSRFLMGGGGYVFGGLCGMAAIYLAARWRLPKQRDESRYARLIVTTKSSADKPS